MRAIFKKIAVTLSLLLLASSLYAQEVAKDKVFVWDNFQGGIATKPSAVGLPKSYATICENARFDVELNSIVKRDQVLSYGSADTTEAITGMFRLYLSDGTKKLIVTHGDEIEVGSDSAGTFTTILDVSSDGYRWQWLTWHDLAIGCDGYNRPVKTNGTVATYLGSCAAVDAGSGAGPNGTYTYKITFYTTSYEVSLNQASNSITVTDNDIDLSMIPIGPDTFGGEDITGRKVYRTSNGGSDYKLLTNGTIADNSTVILTDSDADAARGAALSPGYNYRPPLGKFSVINANRLWFCNDPTNGPSRAYYSDSASHDYFITGDYFNIRLNDGDEITFAKNLLGILTIGKNNTIQQLYTERADPDADWAISNPLSIIGCQAPYTAVVTPTGIVYLASDGLYNWSGQYSKLVSDVITPTIGDISPSTYSNCWSEFHKNIYYMAYTSESSGSAVNNRVLVYDRISNGFTIDLLSLNAFCVFDSGTDWDILYSGSSGDGTVYSHSGDVHEIAHRKHTDFTGTWDDSRYIPTTVGGDANSPVIEIAWTEAINDIATTINNTSGDINRPDLDGSYVSQVLQIGALSFDTLYWNEIIPGAGGDVTFQLRSGSTPGASVLWVWGDAYSDPSGTDVSGTTANEYIQYKINLTTSDIDYTPNLYNADNYVVRLTYNKEGSTTESSIPLHWRSGWLDFGIPGYVKTLTELKVWHEGSAGQTLTLEFENFRGDTDSFEIDLTDYPNYYVGQFTNGAFSGELISLDITENSLKDLKVKKILVLYSVEPMGYQFE